MWFLVAAYASIEFLSQRLVVAGGVANFAPLSQQTGYGRNPKLLPFVDDVVNEP
jgi:hypothetical protein